MKNILFYVHSLNKGGAERVLLTVADELNIDPDYHVVILTDTVDELEYELPNGLTRINLKEYMRGDSAVNRIGAIRRIIINNSPDKIIVFMLSSVIRAVLALMFTKYKVIASVRSNPYDDYSKGRKRSLLLWCMRRTEKIICQTQYQVDFFPEDIRKKCAVISNPIFPEFAEMAKKLAVTDGLYHGTYQNGHDGGQRKSIVATGRLFDYKNHKLLIRAFAKISDKFPDVDLIVYGEGPYREQLEQEISTLGLRRVFLPGDSSKVAEDIADACLYVLPSDTEGLPNALMEAMALGLPVIATDCPCGGPRSLIQDGINGMLVPVGDTEAMADAIEKLLSNDDLRERLGRKAAEITDTNNLGIIVDLWKSVL